nr:hypothetical protein Itr_chr09CG18230 [Ipomoea trifida]
MCQSVMPSSSCLQARRMLTTWLFTVADVLKALTIVFESLSRQTLQHLISLANWIPFINAHASATSMRQLPMVSAVYIDLHPPWWWLGPSENSPGSASWIRQGPFRTLKCSVYFCHLCLNPVVLEPDRRCFLIEYAVISPAPQPPSRDCKSDTNAVLSVVLFESFYAGV